MPKQEKPIIVIVGPTASGKSGLAVRIAQKFGGEIISADSRQVYKGMDIGTGKITKAEMRDTPHHLLDVANPKRVFTVTRYRKLAEKAIEQIQKRGRVPVVCGGTGFYIRALIDRITIPEVPPNLRLRENLEKKTTLELFEILKSKDPRRSKEIDSKNPRRLIRALEIIEALKKVPRLKFRPRENLLMIGIKKSPEVLRRLIKKRLGLRLQAGMLREIKILHAKGVFWKKLENFGLEYEYGALFLQKKLARSEFESGLYKAIVDYAKRQITWFKKDNRIHWIQKPKEAVKLVENFIN